MVPREIYFVNGWKKFHIYCGFKGLTIHALLLLTIIFILNPCEKNVTFKSLDINFTVKVLYMKIKIEFIKLKNFLLPILKILKLILF